MSAFAPGGQPPRFRTAASRVTAPCGHSLTTERAPHRAWPRRYLIFDGDVDAVWVENMNSVMDDNKLLTLPNGERIRLQNHCKLLFEVYDLQYASPATISRCGMVYVDSRNLGYRPYVWTWLNGRTKQTEVDILKSLFDKYASPCVDWVLEGVDGDDLVSATRRGAAAAPRFTRHKP